MAPYEEQGKEMTNEIAVQIEDEEENISHNSTCTVGRMVKEKDIQVDLLDPLIKESEDKLVQLMALYEEQGNKMTKDIVVQIEDEEREQNMVKEKVPQVETLDPLMKETQDKLALWINSYKETLIPLKKHKKIVRDLCRRWEQYINKFKGEHKNTVVEMQKKVTMMENEKKKLGQLMDGVLSCKAPSRN